MIKIENSHRTFFNLLADAGMLLSIVAAGCSTTVESQPEAANALESGGPMPASVTSFLGPDASKLARGTKGGAAFVQVSPNSQRDELKRATSFRSGDAQKAMDYWAQTIPQRVNQFKSGTEATAQSH